MSRKSLSDETQGSNNSNRTWIGATVACVAVAAGLAWAGVQSGYQVGNFPVFSILIGLAFLINWLVFIPSYRKHTEKYFDLTGSLTYISIIIAALALSSSLIPARGYLGYLLSCGLVD